MIQGAQGLGPVGQGGQVDDHRGRRVSCSPRTATRLSIAFYPFSCSFSSDTQTCLKIYIRIIIATWAKIQCSNMTIPSCLNGPADPLRASSAPLHVTLAIPRANRVCQSAHSIAYPVRWIMQTPKRDEDSLNLFSRWWHWAWGSFNATLLYLGPGCVDVPRVVHHRRKAV